MSELSTVRCDRALGFWIAGTRASSVDGELPWRCCGRWTVRWTAVKGSRDRSLDRAAAVASTPGSRAQAATEGRNKTKEADGGWRRQVMEVTGIGLGTDRRRAASRAVSRPRRERRLGPWRGGGNLPARGVLTVFSKPPPTRFRQFSKNCPLWRLQKDAWRHQSNCVGSKQISPSRRSRWVVFNVSFPVLPLRAF